MVEPIVIQFGRNVAVARVNAGFTQEQLHRLCGIHPTEISRIENGKTNVKITTVGKLAQVLKVSPGQLLDGPLAARPSR